MVLFCFFFAGLSAGGQEYWEKTPNDLRVYVGLGPVTNLFEDCCYYEIDSDDIERASYYWGNKVSTLGYSIEYSYQFTKRFALAAKMGFSGVYQDRFDLLTDTKVNRMFDEVYSITPVARFYWVSHPAVRLYSSLGLSVLYERERTKSDVLNGCNRIDNTFSAFFDVRFLGLTVGRRLYGTMELGIGLDGIIKFGVGYRF